MKRTGILALLVLAVALGGGCATKANYMPPPSGKNYSLPYFAAGSTTLIVNDARDDRSDTEGLAEVIRTRVLLALTGKGSGKATIDISIVKHEADFSPPMWTGHTAFAVNVTDEFGSSRGAFLASGVSSKWNAFGYFTARSVSDEAFEKAMDNLIVSLQNIPPPPTFSVPQHIPAPAVGISVPAQAVPKSAHVEQKNQGGSYTDKIVSISIEPVWIPSTGKMIAGYRAFNLKITNLSSKDLFLSWDKSYFLENGEAQTGFTFKGIRYVDRDAPKKDLLILPGTTVQREISPNSKIVHIPWSREAEMVGLPTGWLHGIMQGGEFGGYFKVYGDKYDNSIKLVVNLN